MQHLHQTFPRGTKEEKTLLMTYKEDPINWSSSQLDLGTGPGLFGPAQGTIGPARQRPGPARILLGPCRHGMQPRAVPGLARRHDGRHGTARLHGPCLGRHGTIGLRWARRRHGTIGLRWARSQRPEPRG